MTNSETRNLGFVPFGEPILLMEDQTAYFAPKSPRESDSAFQERLADYNKRREDYQAGISVGLIKTFRQSAGKAPFISCYMVEFSDEGAPIGVSDNTVGTTKWRRIDEETADAILRALDGDPNLAKLRSIAAPKRKQTAPKAGRVARGFDPSSLL